jgi:hypothetical protein
MPAVEWVSMGQFVQQQPRAESRLRVIRVDIAKSAFSSAIDNT